MISEFFKNALQRPENGLENMIFRVTVDKNHLLLFDSNLILNALINFSSMDH